MGIYHQGGAHLRGHLAHKAKGQLPRRQVFRGNDRRFPSGKLQQQPLHQPLHDGVGFAAQQFLRPVARGVAGGGDRQLHPLYVFGQPKLVMLGPGFFGDSRCAKDYALLLGGRPEPSL